MSRRLYIPGSDGKHQMVKSSHSTNDIIDLLISQTGRYDSQTKAFEKSLRGMSVRDASREIWNALKENIRYKADPASAQNLKSPARLFTDMSGDCKSYSLFTASVLRNLGIPFGYRFVSWKKNDPTPTHVYTIADPGGPDETIIDAVIDRFDYEKPHPHEQNIKMPPLNMLTGVDDRGVYYPDSYTYPGSQMGFSIKKAVKKVAHQAEDKFKKLEKKVDPKHLINEVKKDLNKVVAVVKKTNPALVLIRNGMLAMAKVNLFNFAGKLRLAYYTPQEAQAKHYDMNEWNKLVKEKNNMEATFRKMGGNPENLKHAILSGKRKLSGCASLNGEMGIVVAAGAAAAVAAATPIVLTIIKSIKDKHIDYAKMTAQAAKGYEELQAGKDATVTAEQMDDIVKGVDELQNGDHPTADNSGNPGRVGPKPSPGGKKDGNNTMLLVGGAALVYFLFIHKQ